MVTVGLGELLASAVVKMTVTKLASVIVERASLVWNVRKHMQHMKDTLETMAATLQDAEKQSIKSAEVRLWLKRLKNASYDISDMLDEFQEMSNQQMTGIVPVVIRKNFQAYKMKRMRHELKEIEALHASYKFAHSTNAIIQQPYDQRETTSDVNESDIRGRDAEKLELIELLSVRHDRHQTMILPIYGLGGIGKSTLAAHVYSNTQFKEYDHRVWVYVSQVFDLKKIGRSIIFQLTTGGQQNTDTLQLINRSLDDLLCSKKVLIVLDDLWEEDDSVLEKLKIMLHKKGSMIDVIVTTRNKQVARKICTCEPYQLQPLTDDICWDIIKRYSQFEYNTNKEQLEHIGLDIARKCGGVALAAQALGYMLKSKDLHGWSEVNDSDIWIESFEDDNLPYKKVLPSLKLSFEKMHPRLKLCFSYCSIFPKGHNINEDKLIHQWVGLDLINLSKGKEYIKQLLGMSFLQKSKLPLICAREAQYTMHDLVHDLATSVMGDELIAIDATKKSNTSGQKSYRYAFLTNYEGQTKLSNILPQKVRALHFSGNFTLGRNDGSFCFAKCLRVLDLTKCEILPACIGQLKQLRYLNAVQMQNTMLPEGITELTKLQYLNLHGSSQISALPETIGKLSCLIYFRLSDCFSITKLPESFGDLKSMVHLDMSSSGIRELPDSFRNLTNLVHIDISGSGIRELPDSFGNLTNLEYLDLSNCSSVKEIPKSLCDLTKLQRLDLSCCEQLERLPEDIGTLNLQYLSIRYCSTIRKLPRSFEKLRNLLHLDLSCCPIMEGLPGALHGLTALRHLDLSFLHHYCPGRDGMLGHGDLGRTLGKLTNLKYLSLSNSTFVLFRNEESCRYVDRISNLINLEHLDLSQNRDIIFLPESIGNLKRLQKLDLTDCMSLKFLPESICANSKMKSLLVKGCSAEVIYQASSQFLYPKTLPIFKVRAGASGCSNLYLLEGINTDELIICSLEDVRCLEDAQKCKLSVNQNLSDLTFAWTLGADRFLEDSDLLAQLVPPRSLRYLRLEGYSSTGFPIPSWHAGISHHLPNLVEIYLYNMPKCSSLPPLGQLPNLEFLTLSRLQSITKIGTEICGGKGAFCRLLSFTLFKMNRLEEWNTTYINEDGVEVFLFPMLDMLRIWDCPRLRLKPVPPTFSVFNINSDQVIYSLGEVNSSSHLSTTRSTKLCIGPSDCQDMTMLCHFPTLKELELFCGNLTSVPEHVRYLSSLQSLELRCRNISALPEWLGDLSALRNLTIKGCWGIKSLPPCIRLINLHQLHISHNREQKEWCESEENRMKLAHIHDKSL